MPPDIIDSQRLRLGDQNSENPSAARKIPDCSVRLIVDTQSDEPLQRIPLLVENTDGRVARAGQLAPGLEHALEDHVQLELGHE